MFDGQISNVTDELLKQYKGSQGYTTMASLCVELEKTEIGARLISKHKAC